MKSKVLRTVITLVAAFSFVGSAAAQGGFLEGLFKPKVFKVTDSLRAFIRDQLPPVSHSTRPELEHVDLIYSKAMQFSGKDVSTALLACSFAVLSRTDIRPTIPLLGVITLPLPAEDSADAMKRIAKLPRYFMVDSPQRGPGDSDKLLHFFGSAYLTYETGTRGLPDAIGELVEKWEVALKLDSLSDPRDTFANKLGQQFGAALSEGRTVLPSDFLLSRFIKN